MFRRVYFSRVTGNKIATYSFNNMISVIPTFEEDKQLYDYFDGLSDESVGYLDFSNGECEEDFRESNGNYQVNINLLATLPQEEEYKALEFSYPDPNNPETPPVFVKPLTEQIEELKMQTQQVNSDLSAFMDFVLGGM